MKEKRLLSMFIVALFVVAGATRMAPAAPIDDLIAAAKKEGRVEYFAPGTLTPKAAKAIAKAFNKKHGLDIKVNYTPSGGISRQVGMLISQSTTGMEPEWDVMSLPDTFQGRLFDRKLQQPFDYSKLGVNRESIHYKNGSVAIYSAFALPGYNTKLVAPKDVPKKWEDLLDPKWTGKLGQSTLLHHLARLAVTDWGEERTTKFVEGLAKQNLILGRIAEILQRLQLGEIQAATSILDAHIFRSKKTGAPIALAEEVSPVVGYTVQAGVLKGARHPNAGHLFAAFLTTPEAQKIMYADFGESLHTVAGTPAYKLVKSRKVVFMTDKDARTVGKLQRKYSEMVGFKRRRRGKKGKKNQ